MEQTLRTIRKMDIYGIHFDFDKATLRPEASRLIADIGETLKLNPTWTLAIIGHTDAIGEAEYNQQLSLARAKSVVASLVNVHGIAPNRLSAVGAGESQPKAPDDTLQGRAENRRVELSRTDR